AGIGYLLDQFALAWDAHRNTPGVQARIGAYEYGKRTCTRVETIYPPAGSQRCEFSRTVIYFDREHHLPIRIELYDWPEGTGEGGLLEEYSYMDLALNVGVPDSAFLK